MTLLPNLPDIGEYAPKIFPSLIMLFDGLKRAYEAAKDDEDSDDDSDEVILQFSGRLEPGKRVFLGVHSMLKGF